MDFAAGFNAQHISPKRKRDEIEPTHPQFAPRLDVNLKYPIPTLDAGEDSPRTAVARQLQDFRIRGGVPHISFGEGANLPNLAKRLKPTHDVQRQPRVRHTPVFRRRPSYPDAPQRRRRSSSAPPPSERLEGLLVTSGTLANEHHLPLDPTPILSPPSQQSSPRCSPTVASPFLAMSLAKSATTSPVPSPRGLMLPPSSSSIAASTLHSTAHSPPPRRPPPITVSPSPLAFTTKATPSISYSTSDRSSSSSSSTVTSSSTNNSTPGNPATNNTLRPPTQYPIPLSPTSPLSPTALTWKPAEITGHLLSATLDTPDDDGTGFHGIGFAPSPQLALARRLRRRQQLAEWRAREAREARLARWRKRDGTGAAGVGVGGGTVGEKVVGEGVSEVGGGQMKRVVRFA
ncbi:MAG: hypothetical protein M1822_001238 [Bathelium mastoideum]|nr:MAG: hypothetical protein M1822_001238 [Bathelium mastoideum]